MKFDYHNFIKNNTEISSCPSIPGIYLHLATEDAPLWKLTDELLKNGNYLTPFWPIAWPGGQGMARYIIDNPIVVKDKRVLDFAAGCGISAIAAMKAGAKSTIAIDIDLIALDAIKINSNINKVYIETKSSFDFKKNFKDVDIIMASDIFYNRKTSIKVIRWLRLCVERDVLVLISDPGRAYIPKTGMVNLASYSISTSIELEASDMRIATIWRMEKNFLSR